MRNFRVGRNANPRSERLLMMRKYSLLLLCAVLTFAASARAETYAINATLGQGGTVTGTFDYTLATGYTDIDITVGKDTFGPSEASTGPSYSFGPVTFTINFGSDLFYLSSVNYASTAMFTLEWVSPLSGVPDTLSTRAVYDYGGTNTIDDYSTGSGDYFSGGTVTPVASVTSVTPEPSSMVLLGTGVLGVAGMVRRKFLKG